MRQSLKIAISLLASLLLFAGFAVLGFSGLFDVLQASFFLPRIEQVYQGNLDRLASRIDQFHQANLELFANAAKKDFVAASFDLRLSDATLKAWADAKTQIGFFGVRPRLERGIRQARVERGRDKILFCGSGEDLDVSLVKLVYA